MQDFRKFILPIVSDEYEFGCGCFVGNYFITAGHIFDSNSTHYINFEGKKYQLSPSNAIYLRSCKTDLPDNEVQDIAIFKFENINSPLSLCGCMPYPNSEFTNYSFINSETGALNPYIMIECNCRVVNRIFNFFECDTSLTLHEGSSGSPIIYDNVVYGILSGCLNTEAAPKRILFCSTLHLPSLK